jgi:hypothetical protein
VPERVHRIEIALENQTLSIPWTSRDALLNEFEHVESMGAIRKKFDGSGASVPLSLDVQEKRDHVDVIQRWADTTEGAYTRLSHGISELRSELIEDLER